MKNSHRTTWIRLGLVVVALGIAGGGYALLRYQLWPAYRTWSIDRMNTMAHNFLVADDPRNALLTVRKVLGKRPNNAEAWRLGVKAAEMRSSLEAVMFQRNLCRVEKSTANQVELIRLALKYEVYSIGLDAIQAVADEAKHMPEYHRLAAATYRKVRQDAAAKIHLVSLLGLEPADKATRLALAEVEFAADRNSLPADWAERVATLARDPVQTLPATVLQLRSAVARRAPQEAAELSRRLLMRSDLDLTTRLYLAEAAYLHDPPAAGRMLAAMQEQAVARPDDVVQIMEFLLAQAQYEAIRTWYPVLPEKSRQEERSRFVTAQACQALRDWAGMEKLLRGPRWQKQEPLRLGLLAYAYRMAGRTMEFSETWRMAVGATGQDARQVLTLLRNIEQWKWEGERYDLLWKLFNLMPTMAGVQDLLVAHEYRNGNTVNLNKIYARAIEAAPGDENARNNFAYTSLLLGTNENRARQLAHELNLKHPENSSYLTTYTLALHKQGLSREALALVEKSGTSGRTAPATMLHEAIYAAAVGQPDRAGRLLTELESAKLLPEERGLAENAKAAVARLELSLGRQSEIAALGDAAATDNGWLTLLSARRPTAPTDLRLADAYYREKNISALQKLLQGTRWANDEHLRYGLLAYAERQQARESIARDFWRRAVSSAGRDPQRLRDLEMLATHWNWLAERMEIIDRVFESETSIAVLPDELLEYYRRQARTPDLARLYWRYVERTNSTGPEAAWCVYYSLLCGMNVTFAQTLAEKIYAAAPQDPRYKTAYAYSLWRQQRANEALPFLQDIEKQELAGMQGQLVAAGVLLDLGRADDARLQLGRFNKMNALPEEIALAETLSRKLGLVDAVIVSSTH